MVVDSHLWLQPQIGSKMPPNFLCLQVVQQRIQSMSKTLIEIQKREAGLSLPNTAEETLTVLAVVEQLQSLLEELEKVRKHGSD